MFKEIKNYDYRHATEFDFKVLCELLANEQHGLAVEQIKVLAQEIESKNLYFDKGNYTRNIIRDNKDCWLGLLCWDKGAITRIHGHPEQSFIYILEGSLSCKSFDKDALTELKFREINNREFRYNKGIKGKMDNYIHQISATQKSISLHYYSDNPMKGEIFDI